MLQFTANNVKYVGVMYIYFYVSRSKLYNSANMSLTDCKLVGPNLKHSNIKLKYTLFR